MTQSFSIDFKLLVGEHEDDWISIDHLLGESVYLVDYFSSIDNLYCCLFQGGYFIDIDGKPWSDDGHVDELHMTVTWFHALKQLLNGHPVAHAHPWEESQLTLTRQDETLIMEDIHHSGHIAMPKVEVPLYEFVAQLIAATMPFLRLVKEVAHEIEQRRATGVTADIEEKFAEIERHLLWNIEGDINELGTALKHGLP